MRALSVSEALGLARKALEGVRLVVVGEVSEVSDKPSYKAVYFSLADEGAVMPCLMWRDAYSESGVSLRCGSLVEAEGVFTVYAAKGRMQFQVRRLALAGEGVLRMQVAALARRLQAEGLTSSDRKRRLPAFPTRIGLVTSPRGKAVHDVIRTLGRRYPVAELLIAGVLVEGDGAAEAIVKGLRVVTEAGADVVILGRGGGSYEDLMPFNSEAVARAVASCPIPVVTGIGHEPDTTIADMVSDLTASTPTAAAEAATPASADLMRRLEHISTRLARGLAYRVQALEHRVALLSGRPLFCDARRILGAWEQTLDGLSGSLERALPRRLDVASDRLRSADERLVSVGGRLVSAAGASVALLEARLGDLSPLGILRRGYSVCYAEDGETVIRSAGQVSLAEIVRVRLADGALGCRVETKEEEAAR